MKGLFLKDILVLTKAMKLMLLLIIGFCFLDNMRMFVIFYGSLLTISTIAYDEQNKWNDIAAMMPYSSVDMVLEKFIFGYCGAAIGFTFVSIAGFITGMDASEFVFCVMELFAALILFALTLMLIFKFGVEKARFAYIIFIAACSAAAVIFSDRFTGSFIPENTLALAVPVVAAVSVLFNIAAILLSVKFYEQKKV